MLIFVALKQEHFPFENRYNINLPLTDEMLNSQAIKLIFAQLITLRAFAASATFGPV